VAIAAIAIHLIVVGESVLTVLLITVVVVVHFAATGRKGVVRIKEVDFVDAGFVVFRVTVVVVKLAELFVLVLVEFVMMMVEGLRRVVASTLHVN